MSAIKRNQIDVTRGGVDAVRATALSPAHAGANRFALSDSRPLFLRDVFNDAYLAFPSLNGKRFIYRKRLSFEYFAIDLYDARGNLIESDFSAHRDEILRRGDV